MPTSRPFAFAFLAAAAAAAATSCAIYPDPAVWIDEERSLSVDVADASRLLCTTHNGFITSTPAQATPGRVEIVAFVRAGGADDLDAQACLDAVELITDHRNGRAIVEWDWRETRRRTWVAMVSFRITQPAELDLTARTHNGEVRAERLVADCKLRTHNGDIWVRDTQGAVDLVTHNGDIKVEDCRGALAVETHNGHVAVHLVPGPAEGTVRTHNGGVEVHVADATETRLVCETHNGRVRAEAASGRITSGDGFLVADYGDRPESELKVRTHNGGVTVRDRTP